MFAERFGGTNGIGLALAERQLINVYGAEHFAERSQSNACAAIPVRDLLSGRIEGVLCLGYPLTDADAGAEHRDPQGRRRHRTAAAGAEFDAGAGLLEAYLEARRRAPSGDTSGNGQLGELAESGLDWRDQMILKERATELITSAQRAAVEVSLPGGRRVTLLSRPVTSASGVEGIAIEAVLP